jgi:hypothetical protein
VWTVCAQSKLRCQQGTEQRPGRLQSRAQRHSVHLAQLDWSPMERSSGPQTKLSSDHIALQCARQMGRAGPQFIVKNAYPFLRVCAAARLSSSSSYHLAQLLLSEEFRAPVLPFVIGRAVDLGGLHLPEFRGRCPFGQLNRSVGIPSLQPEILFVKPSYISACTLTIICTQSQLGKTKKSATEPETRIHAALIPRVLQLRFISAIPVRSA